MAYGINNTGAMLPQEFRMITDAYTMMRSHARLGSNTPSTHQWYFPNHKNKPLVPNAHDNGYLMRLPFDRYPARQRT